MCHKLICISLIILICAHSNAFGRAPEPRSDERIYKKIDALFLKSDYRKALDECKRLLKDFPRSRHKNEVKYIKGLCYLKLGDFRNAKNAFSGLIEKAGGVLRQKAYLGLGDAYFLNREYEHAISVYKDFLSSYPKSDIKSSAYFKIAQSYDKIGDVEQANIYIEKLEGEFDESVEGALAKKEFAELRSKQPRMEAPDIFSVQVGYFSDFKNAQNLYQKLLKQRYTVSLQKEVTSGGTFYRVRVGRFKSRRKAERFAKKLKSHGYQTRVYP